MECTELMTAFFSWGIIAGGIFGIVGLIVMLMAINQKNYNAELRQRLIRRNLYRYLTSQGKT